MSATAQRERLRSILRPAPDSVVHDLLDRFEEAARESPSFVPALVAVLALVWFAGDEGGFHSTTFLPATLLVAGLLLTSFAVLPRPHPGRRAVVAVTAFAGYALWSYLSITWADDQGIAWDGANRTVLYAALLALVALWPMRGWAAATLLGVFALGVAVVGLVELVKVEHAVRWIQYFHEGRLGEPAGYVNSNVAMWFMAFWPCAVLAARREVPPWLRGLFTSAAVLLVGLSILGQSRAWLFAMPVALVLAVVLVPGRGRTIASLVFIGGVTAMVLRPLLDVYNAFDPYKPPGAAYSHALHLLLAAAAGAGVIAGGVALYERTVRVRAARARLVSAALVAVVAIAAVGSVGVYAAAKGNPVSAVGDKWKEFKKGGDPAFHGSRLTAAFTTYRYDYWRVAWREFKQAPVLGVGVDNFAHDYLRSGKSKETPAYPHSTPLRPLSETGIVGGLLFYAAMVAALAAALPGLRASRLGGAAAGTGLVMLGYWLVHGSVDFLWEFPVLGGAALLGLGVGIAVGHDRARPAEAGSPLLTGRRALVPAGAAALVLAVGLILPWFAARDLEGARQSAGTDPGGALSRLDRSAGLNPLSPLAQRTAGLIQVRQNDLRGARSEFAGALERDRRDPFSLLMLAAIASDEGQAARAKALMSEARRLAPRWTILRSQQARLARGRRLDPRGLESAFRSDIRVRIGPD
jgi:O-antigen ligase